jgi:hypothetical protein
LEEAARVPERWFGRTPPVKKKSRAKPKARHREKVLYKEEMRRVNAKKRSETARFFKRQGGGDGYFRAYTYLVRKFLRNNKKQSITPSQKFRR